MELQYIIVALIVAIAAGYFVRMMARKAKAFRPKESCGDDCGCGSTSKKAVQ